MINLATHKGEFTIDNVVFQIGPRINAAGRIKHAKDAVSLLISTSLEEAEYFSAGIDIQNTERRKHDSKITDQALSMISNKVEWINRKTTVVYQDDWHKGVIGIVASRLTETYYRPTIVLTKSNGVVAGSARSVVGFDLYEALDSCRDLLDQFGGHKYAAGLTMREENIPALQDRFEEVVVASILPEMLIQEIISKRVNSKAFATVVGQKHLRMTVSQQNAKPFACIGFGLGEHCDLVNSGKYFDICYTIEENNWRNDVTIQLNIKGIRESIL